MDNLEWYKATASNPSGNCVEVAKLPDGGAAVRHSKNPEGGQLVFTRDEFVAFLDGVKGGEFDL
jgi:hypothetical protein